MFFIPNQQRDALALTPRRDLVFFFEVHHRLIEIVSHLPLDLLLELPQSSLKFLPEVVFLGDFELVKRQCWASVIKQAVVGLGLHAAAECPSRNKGLSEVLVVHQQLRFQLVSGLLHSDFPGVLLPVCEVFVQPIIAEKLQFDKLIEEPGLPLPFF